MVGDREMKNEKFVLVINGETVTFNQLNDIISNYGYRMYPVGKQLIEEKLMTREEAVKIAKECGNQYAWYEGEILMLERLGLIKFKEEKTTTNKVQLAEKECFGCGVYKVDYLIKVLKEKGYTVKDNG